MWRGKKEKKNRFSSMQIRKVKGDWLIRMLVCWYCCLLELYMNNIMALEIEFTKEIAGICPLPFVILSNTFPSPSHHHHRLLSLHPLSLHLFYFFSSFPNSAFIPFLISDLSFLSRIIPSYNYVNKQFLTCIPRT